MNFLLRELKKWCHQSGSAAMLAIKRLTGVTPEVNLRNSTQARKHASKSTLALKPRADVTRSPKQGYQWPHKKDMCPPKIYLKKNNKWCHHKHFHCNDKWPWCCREQLILCCWVMYNLLTPCTVIWSRPLHQLFVLTANTMALSDRFIL